MEETEVKGTAETVVQEAAEADTDVLGIRVAELLAAALGEDVTALPPLNETLDTEAVQRLFDTVESPGRSVRVVFEYHGSQVVIDETERIEIRTPMEADVNEDGDGDEDGTF